MAKIQLPLAELRKRSIFVAAPMYGGMCTGPFTKSLLDLQALCQKYGVNTQFYFLFNESLITRARNYLVDEFLRGPCTHLMFIDSDIEFQPMDVIALLAFDKDINGGPYPKKTIAWEKIHDASRFGFADQNPNQLENFVGDYVFNVAPGTTNIPIHQPVEVLEIGTGFMMVKREVFAPFQKAYPELLFRPDHNRTHNFDGHREIAAFFDTVIDWRPNPDKVNAPNDPNVPDMVGSKRYLSEDYMFCQYARRIGLKVWLCPWMKLKHIGTYVFGGSLEALGALSQKQVQMGSATPVAKNSTDVVTAQPSAPAPTPEAAPAPETPKVNVVNGIRIVEAPATDQQPQ